MAGFAVDREATKAKTKEARTKDKRTKMIHFLKMILTAWQYLREVSGENDYLRYRARVLAQGGAPPTPEAFYLDRLQGTYSRINRCC